jgi:hypothetical protein
MKQIKLTQSKFALVSDEDYEYLNQWKWYALKQNNNIFLFYAVRCFKRKTISMHRVIAERIGIKNPDHIDRNGLNNQRDNLREATRSQQVINQNLRKDNKSGYKGVSWDRRQKKWVARIQSNKKNLHLGYFDDIKEAARAYNEAALKYFGDFAVLNKV